MGERKKLQKTWQITEDNKESEEIAICPGILHKWENKWDLLNKQFIAKLYTEL